MKFFKGGKDAQEYENYDEYDWDDDSQEGEYESEEDIEYGFDGEEEIDGYNDAEEYEDADIEYDDAEEYEDADIKYDDAEEYEDVDIEYDDAEEYEDADAVYNDAEEYENTDAVYNDAEEYEDADIEYNEAEEYGDIGAEYEEAEEYEDAGAEYEEAEEYEDAGAEYEEAEEYRDADAGYNEAEEYEEVDAEYGGQGEYAEEDAEYYAEGGEAAGNVGYDEAANYADEDAASYCAADEYGVQNYAYDEAGVRSDEGEYYEEEPYVKPAGRKGHYPDEDSLPGKESFFARLGRSFRGMDTMDKVMMATGVLVLILAIITGGVFVSARIVQRQVADFADVGKQLDGITLIGEKGLLAVADAEMARLAAASVVTPETEEPEPSKEYEETGYEKQVTVALNFTSIQKDLKIKFINKKTDKLVPNVPFSVTVTDPDGKTFIWSDDDMDGIIYKKDITPGSYKVTMETLTDSKYADYIVSTETQSTEVKKDIAYKKVDVANEVKKESEVNAAKEDTKKNETVVESVLQDTVTWVESKVIGETYSEVSKNTIPDPMTIAADGRLSRMNGARIVFVSETTNPTSTPADPTPTPADPTPTPAETAAPTPTPEGTATPTPTPEETATPTPTPEETPTPTPSPSPTASPTPSPTASPTPSPTATPTPSPSVSPSPSPTVSPTPAPIKISLDKASLTTFTEVSATVSATVTGAVNKDPAVTAESSNTNAAKVSVDKRTITVTGVGEGTATITVKYTENNQTVTATCAVTVKRHPKEDKTTPLKEAGGQQLYVLENGQYRAATRADYYTADKFFVKTGTKYTGWQTLDGHVYFFTAEGNKVTGEQVIQGAKYNFASDGALVVGSGAVGIDVSKWNGTIDWNAVKNSGISYVIIRCGYRGSSAGALIEDPKFQSNIKGATAAGLKVGVYFFTQAVDEIEAVEEASMVLELVKNYKISYPIFLDVESSGGRGDKIDKETRTAVCKAFCQTIQNAGYTAGIYANKTWLTSKLDPSALSAYKIWLAQYAAAPTYTGRYDLWQYRSDANVSGISGKVDMNISYLGY